MIARQASAGGNDLGQIGPIVVIDLTLCDPADEYPRDLGANIVADMAVTIAPSHREVIAASGLCKGPEAGFGE